MEQHYVSSTHNHLMMWTKSKNIHKLFPAPTNSLPPSSAAAAVFQEPMIGGLAWPPRSYSCRFCRREFRSAQALGGHMNVHRRDRARLKHRSSSSSPPAQLLLQADDETAGKFHHHQKHAYSKHELPADDQNPILEKRGSSVGTDLVDGRIDVICNKRHKMSSGVSPILPFFLHGNKHVSSSEIDLELRLGEPILRLM